MKNLKRILFALGISTAAIALAVDVNTYNTSDNTTLTGTIISATGQFLGKTGTAASPSYSFTSDPNTGIISSAADSIGFVTGGTERWVINASGAFNPIANNSYDIGTAGALPRDLSIGRDASIGGALTVTAGTGNIGWNTYTPSLTNGTNVAAATAYVSNWMRVGNMVWASGQIDLDPTSTGATVLGISLPVASNLASSIDLAGTVSALGATEVFGIQGDSANDRATVNGLAVNTANHQVSWQFMYIVK